MTAAWFASPARLCDVLLDLVLAEMAALRPGQQALVSDAAMRFDGAGLALDSLEMMALSSALSRTLHLHESQIADNLFNQPTLADWQATALQSLQLFSQRISFKSSGSVGLKKYQSHDLAQLEQEAAFLGQLLAGRQRILRAVPAHHIYGFMFTILLPRYLAADIAVVDIRGVSANALQAMLQTGDLIVAYPEFWQYLASAQVHFAEHVVGVNSSGPCPPEVAMQLLALNLSSFIEVYGASETAGIAWRSHPLNAYALMPFWQKISEHAISRSLADGNSQTYQLPDYVQWRSSTEFLVTGRKDAMVQVGGMNVSLDVVREKLLQHPMIEDAAVRLMLPEEGGRLKAFIVLKPAYLHLLAQAQATHQDTVLAQIQHYIASHFSVAEQAKSITLGHSIPVNHMGKRCDWPIA